MRKSLRNIKFICLLIAINLLSFSQAIAVCEIDSGPTTSDFGSYSGPILVTQIFTACETGPLNKFDFKLLSHGYQARGAVVTIEPYSAIGFLTSSRFDLGTMDIFPDTYGKEETFSFTPIKAYEVTAGETYQLRMTMFVQYDKKEKFDGQASGRSGGFEFSQTFPSNPAIGLGTVSGTGSSLLGGATGRMIPALSFNVQMGNPAAPIEPIPTMNEWGLMIFGLLLLNLGLYFVYKKELEF